MRKLFSSFSHWKVNLRLFPLILILLLTSSAVVAQTKVTGIVKDQAGMAIPGVNVLLVGSKTSIITSFDGRYSIVAPANGEIGRAHV